MKYYETRKKQDNFYLIFENYASDSHLVMGLFLGKTKAALIDSGMGMFGTELKDVVAGITDKPVINLLTHGHPDHIGGSVLFDEVYMNCRDEDQIPRLSKEKRLGDTRMFSHDNPEVQAYAEANAIDCSGFQYKNMDEGDVFDLGGLTLQILALPGHSRGSLAMYCKELNIACVGDAFSAAVPASIVKDLSEFQKMADHIRHFLEVVPEDAVLYGGHWVDPIDRNLAVDEMLAAEELAHGQTDEDEEVYLPISPVPHQKRHVHGRVGISYNPAILK